MDTQDEAAESNAPSRPARSRKSRRHASSARVLAFKVLYEVDIARHGAADVFERLVADEGVPDEESTLARALIRGVMERRTELDDRIQMHAPSWPLEQLSAVERNILRIAVFELLHERQHIPIGVAINEAVELAKMFGGDAASRFVNGVLGQVVRTDDLPSSPEETELVGGDS
ncbi:MAG: transcription antitermination factor NusB [Chloroflexota bacterium]